MSTKTITKITIVAASVCTLYACQPQLAGDEASPADGPADGPANGIGQLEIQSARIPRVTAVSPPTASNLGGTALTITGKSFAPGAQVYIGGVMAPYPYINSSTQITVTIPQKNFPVGAAAVKVVNPDGRSSERSDVLTMFNDSVSLIGLRAAVGRPGSIVSVADLNGDGKQDVIIGNGYPGSEIHVFLSRGRGDYVDNQTLTVPGAMPYYYRVDSGDFNGDGKIDIIVGGGFGPPISASVFLNRGDGSFGAPVTSTLSLGMSGTFSNAYVGDVNGDGRTDLVIAGNSSFPVYGLFAFLAASDGSFSTSVNSPITTFLGDGSFADVTGDGKVDLVARSTSSGEIYVAPGRGDGNFNTPLTSTVDTYSRRVVLGDWNVDGKLDLASLGDSGKLSIRLGKGDGTFTGSTLITVDSNASGLDRGDVNGDGKQDLIVGFGQRTNPMGPPTPGGASLLSGNGDGTFATARALNIAPLSAVDSVRILDADKDGKLDVLLDSNADAAFTVLYGRGGGNFIEDLQLGAPATAVASADLNGDGKADIVTVSVSTNKLYVALGNGDGTTGTPRAYDTDRGPSAVLIVDVTGDGKADLLVTNYDAATVSLLPGNGDGTFNPQRIFTVGAGANALVTQDMNGDGKLDLVTANYEANNVSVLLNNGTGGFNAAKNYSTGTGTGPGALAAGDFNGDGKADVVTANADNNTVSFLQGSAVTAGALNTAKSLATGKGPNTILARDVNGDGKLDVVTGNGDSSDISLLTGKGDGTFNAATVLAQPGYVGELLTADFNGDGRADLAAASGGTFGRVTLLYGFAGGVYSPSSRSLTAGGPLAAPDMNGDGKLDLIVGQNSGSVLVYLNK